MAQSRFRRRQVNGGNDAAAALRALDADELREVIVMPPSRDDRKSSIRYVAVST